MNHPTSAWICCQLGAREHYAIPRALQRQGMLSHLITDAWVKPGFGLKHLPIPALKRLQDRYHVDLAGAKIRSFTSSLIWFELSQRRQQTGRWERIMARNQWFQQQALQVLQELAPRFKTPPILFCFSYAALELLRFAQQQGWRTILARSIRGHCMKRLSKQSIGTARTTSPIGNLPLPAIGNCGGKSVSWQKQ